MTSMWGVPINTEMYFGTPSPAPKRPLRPTDMFGNPLPVRSTGPTDMYGNPLPPQSTGPTDMYGNPLDPVPQPVPQQQTQRPPVTTDLHGNPIQVPVKPAQHGNQNPFRNQGDQQNQNRNNERTLIPVNNQSQAGPSNANQALVVQVNDCGDWSIQLSSDAPDGTACFAEIVKDLNHASGGESSANSDESSEDEDSSGYSRSSDEESSSSGDDHLDNTSSASVDANVDELLEEAAAENHRRSILVDQAAYSSSSLHSAIMANVDSSSSQVCVDEPTAVVCDSCDRLSGKCADLEANMSELQAKHDALQASLFDLQDKHVSLNDKWCELQSKHEALQEKYDVTFIHNQKLTVDLSKCTEANMFYENHEKEFKSMIETLKKDQTDFEGSSLPSTTSKDPAYFERSDSFEGSRIERSDFEGSPSSSTTSKDQTDVVYRRIQHISSVSKDLSFVIKAKHLFRHTT